MAFIKNVLMYSVNQVTWWLRMVAGTFVMRGDRQRVMTDLRRDGAALIKNFVSEQDLARLDAACKKALDDVDSGAYEGSVFRRSGAIRLRRLELHYFDFNYYRRNLSLMFMGFCIRGKLDLPSVMLSVSHDGSFNHPAVPGKLDKPPAEGWHVDHWRHEMKALIYLDDVHEPENGPTFVLPGSSADWRKMEVYEEQKKWDMKRENGEVDPNEERHVPTSITDPLEKKYGERPLLASRGDVYLFDRSTLHRAGALTRGVRKILWLYF